jgi:hypothetical protein
MAKVTLKVKKGDPVKGGGIEESVLYTPNKTHLEKGFDVRDRIAELVGSNNVLNPDDKAAIYGDLVKTMGQDQAKKVMDHVYIFNTRPEYRSLPMEEKLRSFYALGSNDPDVQGIISKTKSLGYGPQQGFRTSNSQANQILAGRIEPSALVKPTTSQQKIMVQVRK